MEKHGKSAILRDYPGTCFGFVIGCRWYSISDAAQGQVKIGLRGQIRTDDLLIPNQALYQAELREDISAATSNRTYRLECGCSSIELSRR